MELRSSMASTVAISKCVLQAVRTEIWKGTGIKGFLIGPDIKSKSNCNILGVWRRDILDVSTFEESISDCLSHFPGGYNVVGIVYSPPVHYTKSAIENDDTILSKVFEDEFDTPKFLVEHWGLPQAFVLCVWSEEQTSSTNQTESLLFTLTKDCFRPNIVELNSKVMTSIIMMRLKADIPLVISVGGDNKENTNQVDFELTKLQNNLKSGTMVYGLDSNQVLLQDGGILVGAASWSKCKEMSEQLLSQGADGSGGRAKSSRHHRQVPFPVSLLMTATVDSRSTNCFAPVIKHQTGPFQTICLTLPLDVLVEVDESSSMSDLYKILNGAVLCQVSALFQCLKTHKLQMPEVFHFSPSCLDTPVCVIYPRGTSMDILEKERERLHHCLCLPQDRPLLRRGAAGLFLRQTAPGGYLLNTHMGLPDPPVKSATISTVDGNYSYHHYMQDHFNDDKWGCAYRSLQTIVSWFKYQGYTDREIPSHKDIQKALYEVGDKDEKFVGSRKWIGSFEVSFVLDHLLSVSSKFINVNAGSELSSTGQQLANHFQTQGTPVMIGGGVLAHTILGVAYSELTGDICFLILDPHYTGGEDLHTIQDKGWCGWKDMSFWNQTAHYNLCLPQRPICM